MTEFFQRSYHYSVDRDLEVNNTYVTLMKIRGTYVLNYLRSHHQGFFLYRGANVLPSRKPTAR